MRTFSCAALGAVAHFAEVTPQSPAIIEPDGATLTYKDFWGQIEAVGQRLRDAGVEPGQRVAVLLPAGMLQVVAVAGTLKQHVAIPLQARTTLAETEPLLRKLAACALITSPDQEEVAELATELGMAVLVTGKDQLPEAWILRASSSPSATRPPLSEAVLYLVTSGTSGHSKMVPLTAANLDAGVESRRRILRLMSSDRMLLMTSFSHIIGVENALAQFTAGGAVIATHGFDPPNYLRWLKDLGPTWYDCAPTLHQAALVQLQGAPSELPSSLRFLQSAGAPLPPEVRHGLEQLLQVPVFNDYGMTEACPIAVDAFLDAGHVAGSAGRSAGLEIGIMSAAGELLPTGTAAEIVVRGPAVFPGYEDDDEANRSVFHNGWFRTGDLGRLDTDGNLFVTGRLKEMINRGGEKILPAEVDAALASHPAVLGTAAFGVPHPTLGEDVACAIVLRSKIAPQPDARDLRRHAARLLPAFKVPHRFYFVDEIPRGELGKPQRWVLKETLQHQKPLADSTIGSPSFREEDDVFWTLHEIWARILYLDDFNEVEDFFAAGGDSLAAVNMLTEVDRTLGTQTSAFTAEFLDDPTLHNLTRLVGCQPPEPRDDNSSEMQVYPVREAGAAQRLFCIPTGLSEGPYFRRLAKYLQGQMDTYIVRPANTRYSDAPFTLETQGKEAAAAIRRVQPEGPYVVSGYCLGGVVAAEAGRQLRSEGCIVRIILFDVPLPDSLAMLHNRKMWADRTKNQWRALWNEGDLRFIRNLALAFPLIAGCILLPFSRALEPLMHLPIIRRIVDRARWGEFPLYIARSIDAPLLHFLCQDEPNAIDGSMRFGWRRIARSGIQERVLPLNHSSLFHESNLPVMVETILQWCGINHVGK